LTHTVDVWIALTNCHWWLNIDEWSSGASLSMCVHTKRGLFHTWWDL